MAIVLEEVSLDDLIKVEVSAGKITQVLGSIIERLSRGDRDRDELRRQFEHHKQGTDDRFKDVEQRLSKLEAKPSSSGVEDEVAALRSEVERLAADVATQNDAADATLRALIDNHERRIQNAEDRASVHQQHAVRSRPSSAGKNSAAATGPLPAAPECIPGVDALSSNPGAVVVTWVPSSVPGASNVDAKEALGAQVQKYIVRWRGANGQSGAVEVAAAAAAADAAAHSPAHAPRGGVCRAVVPKLAAGVMHTFRVAAVNAHGTSPDSAQSDAVEPYSAEEAKEEAALEAASKESTKSLSVSPAKPPRPGSAAGPGAVAVRNARGGSADGSGAARPGSSRGRPNSAAKSRPMVTRHGSSLSENVGGGEAPPQRRASVLKDGVVQEAPADERRTSGTSSGGGARGGGPGAGGGSSLADRLQQFLTDHERRLRQMESDTASCIKDLPTKGDYDGLEEIIAALTSRVAGLEKAMATLQKLNDELQKKLEGPYGGAPTPKKGGDSLEGGASATAEQLAAVERRLEQKASTSDLAAVSTLVRSLQDALAAVGKGSASAGTAVLGDTGASAAELAALRSSVEALEKVRVPAAQSTADRADATASIMKATVEGLNGRMSALQSALDALMKKEGGASASALEALEGAVEKLRQDKLDKSAASSLAARSYVDEELDKLRDAIDAALRALRDDVATSLEKALGKLKELVDGKASAADLRRAVSALSERADEDASAEGLIGVRGYRCLGCNRKMDSLRPRPSGIMAPAASATPLGIRQRMQMNGGVLPPAEDYSRPKSAGAVPPR